MDDIQDYWITKAQIAVMNLFISYNQSISLGLIMHEFGNDSRIVKKVSEGEKKGLFDLAIHGWDHVEYSKLNETQQKISMYKANEKMNHLFGIRSRIFIPPDQDFNNNTLLAMKDMGFKVISSDTYFDQEPHFVSNGSSNPISDSYGIYHLPSTIGFKDFVGPGNNKSWVRTPLEDIINATQTDISKYGFAVIMMHPQDFVTIDKHKQFTNIIDTSQLKDLSYLLNWMSSNHIKLSTFSEVAHVKQQIQNKT
jgi:peptidoglycan/xylan/chitin deacetylase (PgdA/CDA1 family)